MKIMVMFRSALLSIFLVVLLAACSQRQAPATDGALGPGQVATVNSEPLPESLFRLYAMNAAQKNPDELTAEQRDGVIEDLVRLKLLAAAAEERGLPQERTIAAELELQRLQVTARSMARRYLEENPATDAEIQKMYEDNLPRLASTEYKARHILVESAEEAAAVIEELRQGKDFLALAQERSGGPTGPNGGDLGWFSAESMVQPVAQAVQSMQVGSYSNEPVQTDFGYHVLLLEDTRSREAPSLDSVRDELKNAVDRNKLQQLVTSLREAAEVTISE
jgi:peptidyl-prolyl cis-trans isomerase C